MLQKFTVILSVTVHGDHLMQCICVTEVWRGTNCPCLPSEGYCCSAFRRDQVEKECNPKGWEKSPLCLKYPPVLLHQPELHGWAPGVVVSMDIQAETLLLDAVVLPVWAVFSKNWVVPACAWSSWRIGEAMTISQFLTRTSLFLPGCKGPGYSLVSLISCLNSNFVDFCSAPKSAWKN